MKYTVIYKDTGDVLAVISEQPDIKSIKINTFEVPEGNIIDSIDVSGKVHTAVTHATPMADMAKLQAELEATNKRLEEMNNKRSAEVEEVRKAILANSTMIASISPDTVEDDEGAN
nr:MAG TPA: hypothetical protein [Caudoviricetes sp.]